MTLVPIPQSCHLPTGLISTSLTEGILSQFRKFYPTIAYISPWTGYFITEGENVLGCCAFVGPPADNRVEISYHTFPEFEGRRIATWACREMILIALRNNPELTITAKTAPGHNASTRILTNSCFTQTRVVQDHEIGDAWEWELNQSSANHAHG